MILVWKNNYIEAILRSGQVQVKSIEEVERITHLKYEQLKKGDYITKFHRERLKSQIDYLELFMKRKLMRVALCV